MEFYEGSYRSFIGGLERSCIGLPDFSIFPRAPRDMTILAPPENMTVLTGSWGCLGGAVFQGGTVYRVSAYSGAVTRDCCHIGALLCRSVQSVTHVWSQVKALIGAL